MTFPIPIYLVDNKVNISRMPISFCKARLWLIISFLVHNSLVYSFNTCNVTETQERNERERETWSVFQDTMITWSWGSRKGGVEIAKSMEERGA